MSKNLTISFSLVTLYKLFHLTSFLLENIAKFQLINNMYTYIEDFQSFIYGLYFSSKLRLMPPNVFLVYSPDFAQHIHAYHNFSSILMASFSRCTDPQVQSFFHLFLYILTITQQASAWSLRWRLQKWETTSCPSSAHHNVMLLCLTPSRVKYLQRPRIFYMTFFSLFWLTVITPHWYCIKTFHLSSPLWKFFSLSCLFWSRQLNTNSLKMKHLPLSWLYFFPKYLS